MFMPHFGQGGRTSKQVKARLSSLGGTVLVRFRRQAQRRRSLGNRVDHCHPGLKCRMSVSCQQRCLPSSSTGSVFCITKVVAMRQPVPLRQCRPTAFDCAAARRAAWSTTPTLRGLSWRIRIASGSRSGLCSGNKPRQKGSCSLCPTWRRAQSQPRPKNALRRPSGVCSLGGAGLFPELCNAPGRDRSGRHSKGSNSTAALPKNDAEFAGLDADNVLGGKPWPRRDLIGIAPRRQHHRP